jgi:hypothetical protein
VTSPKQAVVLMLASAAILLLSVSASAQSGRRNAPAAPAPSPTPVASPVVKENNQRIRPKALIIGGSTSTDGGYYHSSDVSDATEEIIYLFNLFQLPCKTIKGGKMTKQQAIDRAKQETEAYVLWLQIAVKDDVYTLGGVTLDRVYYVLLIPQTGRVEYQGEVDPTNIVQTNEQGARLPKRTQGRSRRVEDQVSRSAFEIVRVIRGRLW